jgi:hypothetical protein
MYNTMTDSIGVDDWVREVLVVLSRVDEALKMLDDLEEALGRSGSAKHERLNKLRHVLLEVKDLSNTAYDRYVRSPVRKFASGQRLTRQEHGALIASLGPIYTGAQLGINKWDDFHIFSLFAFQDENGPGYIDPREMEVENGPSYIHPREMEVENGPGYIDPRERQVEKHRFLRCYFAPEEVNISVLTDDQQIFFSEYLPEVYRRFRRPTDEKNNDSIIRKSRGV